LRENVSCTTGSAGLLLYAAEKFVPRSLHLPFPFFLILYTNLKQKLAKMHILLVVT